MNYPYASGTVKALESKVLDKNKLLVLNKYDKSEFVKVLLAMNYGKEGNTLEELILSESLKTRELIDSITPNKKDTDLFYLVNDALNLKLIFKMKIFNINNYDLHDQLGTLNYDILFNAINNNDYSSLSKSWKQLILEINNKIDNISNPKLVSALIDNSVYSYALNNANNSILKKYITLKIDTTNIISLFRARNLNWNYEEFEVMLLDNGKIKIDLFKELFSLNNDALYKRLEPYYEEKITHTLKQINNLSDIEWAFQKLIIEEMSKYKDDPFTIGPMIYYYLLKNAEALNIRLLYNKTLKIKNLI